MARDRVVYGLVTSNGPGGISLEVEGGVYGPGVPSLDPDLVTGDQVPVGFLNPRSSRQPLILSPRPRLLEFPASFLCPHTTRVVGTGCIFDAYLSHATGMASNPPWQPFQRVEATDYQAHTYAGPNPDLCDFDFPSSHPGAPGSDKIYLDWQGDQAYDLMHTLQYP